MTTKKIPLDLFFEGCIKENVLIGYKEDCKNIYSYNIKDGKINIISNVYNPNNFIKSIICNSQWIVWVENEHLISNAENKPYKWQIIAQSVSTGKKIIIDKSSFTSNNYEVPMFINYTPDKLAIYNDTLVYCKIQPNNSKIKTELISCNINNNIKNVISSTNDVMKEMIADCNIYDDKIVWSKYKEINHNYEERLTQYRFSDLFMSNLSTKTVKQLTFNDFYNNPSIFKDKIAAIKIPLKESNQNACNSQVVMIDLNKKEVEGIVNENSPCYNRVENELYRCDPILNEKYLAWKNNSFSNTYIYDYTTKKFINLFEPDSNPHNINRIYTMYNNCVLMYKTKEEQKDDENICIFLDNIN